jgi:hypothetical protein
MNLILLCAVLNPQDLRGQSQGTQANPVSSTMPPYSTVVLGSIPFSPSTTKSKGSNSGTGLTIVPTFDTNTGAGTAIDAATQTVINNAIAFYESTFTSNITVHIYFYNMPGGLGQSTFFTFAGSYQAYCTALVGNASSPDDATAVATLEPCSTNNPVTTSSNIAIKSPTGLALGFATTEQTFPNSPPCPNFTGSGCIGLNVTLANTHTGLLFATVEHEMDEVLGLGSALQGTTTPSDPWPEDLFRWASANTRSFATNTSTAIPCTSGTPAAFFAIDGGKTDLDNFNNCNNGGDYGDWITHTPSQVQDAFTNATGSPSLTATSPEVRALDVIGFNLVASKHRHGQITSQ